jgi:hypothetical protein
MKLKELTESMLLFIFNANKTTPTFRNENWRTSYSAIYEKYKVKWSIAFQNDADLRKQLQ